ncbi:hypothetical protein [Bradyrhizobium sp.]|uniref:hypothetical protein n=1 Tax=Bradyrhizobium sp. TaxID=376 RepID=UPI0023A5FD73|nr:hypothetical protein [Bradyrhizobium sp.]MDE2379492.1 hypothetical protein [Bradyrhizobium sp.]
MIPASRDQAGLHLQAQAPVGIYLLMASVGARAIVGVVVRYRVTLQQRAIGLGVLSADSNKWLSYEPLTGAASSEIEGSFAGLVEPGSHFVIDSQGVDGEVKVAVDKLEWTFVCPRPVRLFDLLFNKPTVPATRCAAGDVPG